MDGNLIFYNIWPSNLKDYVFALVLQKNFSPTKLLFFMSYKYNWYKTCQCGGIIVMVNIFLQCTLSRQIFSNWKCCIVVKTHVRYAFLFSIMSQVFSTVGSKQHTLTGELTKSAANKKSHLPSRGVRCDRGGRVRAQAPGETQQKMETANKKKKTEKESKREETEQKTNDHMKRKSQTEKRPTLSQRKQHYSASALHLHYQTVLSIFHQF